jgi:hypothetical protein
VTAEPLTDAVIVCSVAATVAAAEAGAFVRPPVGSLR